MIYFLIPEHITTPDSHYYLYQLLQDMYMYPWSLAMFLTLPQYRFINVNISALMRHFVR